MRSSPPATARRQSALGALFDRAFAGYIRYGVAFVCATTAIATVAETGWVELGVIAGALALLVQAVLLGAGFALFGAAALLGRLIRSLGTPKLSPQATATLPTVAIHPVLGATNAAIAADAANPMEMVPAAPSSAAAGDRLALRGTVRVAQPITSPLGHAACAAFRVVGDGPLGVVDDGGVTAFEIVGDHGVAEIRAGAAAIGLDVTKVPAVVRPDVALRRFLAERGIFPEMGPLRLAESVLADGEEVEVVGQAEMRRRAEGYRGQAERLVLSGTVDAPLEIRRGRGPPAKGTDARKLPR